MSIKIHSVVNGKTVSTEKVWLQVETACNLSGYAIVDRTFGQTGALSNEFRHIFVFPSKAVAKGDWVCLITGTGNNTSTKNDKGTMSHDFYWGSSGCVWNNNGGDTATLISYSKVSSVTVPKA